MITYAPPTCFRLASRTLHKAARAKSAPSTSLVRHGSVLLVLDRLSCSRGMASASHASFCSASDPSTKCAVQAGARDVDLHSMGKKRICGVWKQKEVMHNVYNLILLSTCFSSYEPTTGI